MIIDDFWEALVARLTIDVYSACLRHGGSVVSGIRSIHRNQDCKGADLSWHLDGLAFDIKLDEADSANDFYRELASKHRYRILINKSDKISCHVQYDWPILKDFIRKNNLSHLETILSDYVKEENL